MHRTPATRRALDETGTRCVPSHLTSGLVATLGLPPPLFFARASTAAWASFTLAFDSPWHQEQPAGKNSVKVRQGEEGAENRGKEGVKEGRGY